MSLNRATLIGYVGHNLEELRYYRVGSRSRLLGRDQRQLHRQERAETGARGLPPGSRIREAGLDLQGVFGQRAPRLRRRTFVHQGIRSQRQLRETLSHRDYRAGDAVPWGATRSDSWW